jgi:DNA-binding MarR family transcriptional regulator
VLRRIRKGIDSVSTLAEANRTSRSSVSKAVEALVRRGLVSRSQNAADRRQVPLALTAEGERALAVIFDEAERWLAEKFQPLDAQELEQALAGMSVLQKVFE